MSRTGRRAGNPPNTCEDRGRCVKQDKERKTPRISGKDLERLADIHKQLKEGRSAMDAKWRDIARYINPDMNWNGEPDAVQKPQESAHVYDTTAIKASNTLADGIQGYSFARNQAWFKLEPEDTPDMNGEESGWLAAAEKEMYRQSQKSYFYDEGRAFVKCAADFGTAIMTRTDDIIRNFLPRLCVALKRSRRFEERKKKLKYQVYRHP